MNALRRRQKVLERCGRSGGTDTPYDSRCGGDGRLIRKCELARIFAVMRTDRSGEAHSQGGSRGRALARREQRTECSATARDARQNSAPVQTARSQVVRRRLCCNRYIRAASLHPADSANTSRLARPSSCSAAAVCLRRVGRRETERPLGEATPARKFAKAMLFIFGGLLLVLLNAVFAFVIGGR